MFRESRETGPHPLGDQQARRMGTIVALDPLRPAPSFADVWNRAYPRLTELHGSFRRDGLLVAAVWNGGQVTEYLHVPLGEEPEFVVVGRHDRCDLSLGHDPELSLRHALIGVRQRGGELRVRLLDLQSGSGFFTEDSRRCEALTADGPMFVRAGGYHLFLLPTGALSPLAWGASAEETWQIIPERVYRDCRLPPRGPSPVVAALTSVRRQRKTIITQIVHPPGLLRRFHPAVGARGARVADVELGSAGGYERFAVHEAEVERGLLVGRYERCQVETQDDKVSRVHLLVIRDGDEIWAVDTSSSNGTTVGGQPVRRVRLVPGAHLVLAQEIVLRWHAAEA